MKLLLVPWGRGMGHITHCLAISKEVIKNDKNGVIYIVADSRWETLIKNFGAYLEVFPSELTSMHPWKEWDNIEHVRRSLAADLYLLKKVKPDIVIHDQRLTMPIACAMVGIPCIMLAQCQQSPDFLYTPDGGSWAFWKETSATFNVVLHENGLPLIEQDVRELIFRYPVIIPSIPEFDPIADKWRGKPIWYTGPLLLAIGDTLPLSIYKENSTKPVVFLYGVVHTQEDLNEIIKVFSDDKFNLMITGAPDNLVVSEHNIQIHGFINALSFLPNCVAAVIHGGHGSCMTLIESGTPAIVLPGSHHELERNWNGQRLEMMGIARCLPGNIQWSRVKDELIEMINEPIYRANALRWQKHIKHWQGPKMVWDILAKIIIETRHG